MSQANPFWGAARIHGELLSWALPSIARFTGTMKGPMIGPGAKEIPPTVKSFEVDFCTVARWDNGEIVEENLFYDVVGLMSQIGISK